MVDPLPASFTQGRGWCDKCQRLTPFAELDPDSHLCLSCRGLPLIHPGDASGAMSSAQAFAEIAVDINYSDAWTVDRREFSGTDVEWKELITALETSTRDRTKHQRMVIEEFKDECMGEVRNHRAHWDCDVSLTKPALTTL